MSMTLTIDLRGLLLPPARLMHGTERQPISHWRAMGRRWRCLQIKPGMSSPLLGAIRIPAKERASRSGYSAAKLSSTQRFDGFATDHWLRKLSSLVCV